MGAGAAVGVGAAIEVCSETELTLAVSTVCADRRKLIKVLAQSIRSRSDRDYLKKLLATKERDDNYRIHLRYIFNECDLNGDGLMSLEELGEVLTMDGHMAREYGMTEMVDASNKNEVMRLFNEADTDDSGTVTWEEFVNMMISVRARRDSVTAEEVMTMSRSLPGAHARLKKKHISIEDMAVVTSQADINDWRIDYFQLDDSAEVSLVFQAFAKFGISSDIEIKSEILRSFIRCIKSHYNDVPYHNFHHAMAALHYSFKLLYAADIWNSVPKTSLLALVLAALCHDCDHRARSNAFEVMTVSSLALRYNDRSVLENHSCALTFELALEAGADGKCNVFSTLDRDRFAVVRRGIVAAILGTDMTFHNNHVKRLQKMQEPHEIFEDPDFILELFLHTADVGNPLMPPDISETWCKRITAEFTAQSADEERLGLPITAMMAGLEDPKKAARSQTGFMDFVVVPLWSPLALFFPGLQTPQEHLAISREAFKNKAESGVFSSRDGEK